MTFTCKACGAALKVGPTGDIVECEFCGASTRVREQPAASPDARPTPEPAAPLRPTGPPPLPPFVPPPGQDAPAARPASRRKGAVVTLVFVLLVAGLAGFFLARRAGLVMNEWYSVGCLVDANGDAVLDVAGWAGTPDDQRTLMVADGATGKILWSRRQGWKQQDEVVCLAGTHVGVARPDFTLEIVPARSPDSRMKLTLSDALESVADGSGCVILTSKDKLQTSIRLVDGSVRECEAGPQRRSWDSPGVVSTAESEATLAPGGVTYRLAQKSPGTPVLAVSAESAGSTLWRTQLSCTAGFVSKMGLAATPSMIMVWGALRADSSFGVLAGLDPASGALRYERQQESTWSGNPGSFMWNGRYVISQWGCGLHAYDPATGELAWHIGGR